MSAVIRGIGCSYDTGRRWKEATCRCPEGCAWHGWDRLEEEQNAANQARELLIQKGNFDPVAHDQAIRKVLAGDINGQETRATILKRTIRSDLERASHWEFVYAKAFYKATGQVIEWNTFQGGVLTDEVRERMQGVMTVGLSPTSFEQCIKIMRIAEEQLSILRGKPVEKAIEVEDDRPMTPAELREHRALLVARNSKVLPKLASGEAQIQVG